MWMISSPTSSKHWKKYNKRSSEVYTYGPLPSRRLGRSLGVSLIPYKTCSYSCLYCQLGKTRPLQIQRKSFFPKEDILAEIENHVRRAKLDFITFAGDGEPTLSMDVGCLIRQCKDRFGKPVAVITNGSLLWDPKVRKDLQQADVVLPSLDAGDGKVFKTINRPHGEISFKTMLDGLITFASEYTGQLWLEVMLVYGINDTDQALYKIQDAVGKIKPNRLYIMTPIRPPAGLPFWLLTLVFAMGTFVVIITNWVTTYFYLMGGTLRRVK